MTILRNGFDIPAGELMTPAFTFQGIVQAIQLAPRPVSLAEVSYALTGNPHFQHLLNLKFSGTKNAAKREEAGLVVAFKRGKTAYWTVLDNSEQE